MPKLTYLRKNTLAILILSIVFLLTGCSINTGEDENSKKEKLNQEMSYLDNKIITMMNRLNNISFSNYKVISEEVKEEKTGNNSSQDTGSSSESSSKGNESSGQQQSSEGSEDNHIFKMSQDVLLLNSDEQNEEIKWEEIRKDIENIYTVWATISIDLASIGVNNQDITEFNNILDDVAIDAKEKNKESSLTNLSMLYNLIPKYMNSYSEELNKNIKATKAYVLTSYSLVNTEKWDEARLNLTKANEAFSNVITRQDNYPNRELNINRSYLLLNDLKQSIEKKDKQIFYVRYKNLMHELNIIE